MTKQIIFGIRYSKLVCIYHQKHESVANNSPKEYTLIKSQLKLKQGLSPIFNA